jgi:hypothetical protein
MWFRTRLMFRRKSLSMLILGIVLGMITVGVVKRKKRNEWPNWGI